MTKRYTPIAGRYVLAGAPTPIQRSEPAATKPPYPGISRAELARLVGEMLG